MQDRETRGFASGMNLVWARSFPPTQARHLQPLTSKPPSRRHWPAGGAMSHAGYSPPVGWACLGLACVDAQSDSTFDVMGTGPPTRPPASRGNAKLPSSLIARRPPTVHTGAPYVGAKAAILPGALTQAPPTSAPAVKTEVL